MLHRRKFLCGSALALGANPVLMGSAPFLLDLLGQRIWGMGQPGESVAKTPPVTKPRIAFLGTVVRNLSHSQHFLDRMTLGYTWGGRWRAPRVEVASVYIDQFPDSDLSRGRAKKHRLNMVATIEDALTLGTGKLAVDGVAIIGEHGDYPQNYIGQYLYPRYEWFKKVVRVFESSGRSVPVFNDKHLSTDWAGCAEMVADSKRLKFPFLAGSSLPVTWRLPQLELPLETPLKESVCVAYGGVDSYDFHALETAQCMSERRKGGETGIRSVWALKGPKLWAELARPERKTAADLVVSALNTSHSLPLELGYMSAPVDLAWATKALPEVTGYLIDHRDGFRTTIILAKIADFNYAGMEHSGKIHNCQFMLPMPRKNATTADFFNPLIRHMEEMYLTGEVPYPIERTLLTSGMVIGGVKSLSLGQRKIETPEMAVAYKPFAKSAFRTE